MFSTHPTSPRFLKTGLAFGVAMALGSGMAVAGSDYGAGQNYGSDNAKFSQLDENNDNQITKDEFHGKAKDMGIYSDWDKDNNGQLSQNEFDELGVDDSLDDVDYDADGYVDSDEFYTYTFDEYDADNSGYWEENEWDDAGDAGWWDV